MKTNGRWIVRDETGIFLIEGEIGLHECRASTWGEFSTNWMVRREAVAELKALKRGLEVKGICSLYEANDTRERITVWMDGGGVEEALRLHTR